MVKTQVVPCTQEEIKNILNAALDDDFYYMLFFVAKSTGRRLGEYYGTYKLQQIGKKDVFNKFGVKTSKPICKRINEFEGGVQVKDLDFERKTMMTYVLKRRKRVQKEALLTDEAIRIIKQYISTHKLTLEDYLFRHRSMRAIENAVIRYAKIAKVPHKVCFHNFRHYFITELVRKGWHYDQIAKLTGHTTPQTLMFYDHVVASDMVVKAQEGIRNM